MSDKMSAAMRETHDHCWRLLPWYVTSRLSSEDSMRIEQHLTVCTDCRDELAAQRELCMHFRRDEPVLLAPQASLQKMLARIDAAAPALADHLVPNHTALTHENKGKHGSGLRAPRGRWLAMVAGVQTIAIGVLLTLLWRQTSDVLTAPRFTTLTSNSAAVADGVMLRVVFKPATTADRMQSLLRAVRAQVIAGPTEAGVYTLRLDDSSADLTTAQALSRVRADDNVIFAEHVSMEHQP